MSSYEGIAGVGNFSLDLNQLLPNFPWEIANIFSYGSGGQYGSDPDTIGWPNAGNTPSNVSAIFVGTFDEIQPLPNPNITFQADTLIVSNAFALQIDLWPISQSAIDSNNCKYWISNITWNDGDQINIGWSSVVLC
jgi:hypothetical protein